MKKVLVITSVASMVDQFFIPNIKLLQKNNYSVCVACNFEKGSTCSKERISELKCKLKKMNVVYYQIDFSRSVAKISENYQAYRQVAKIIKDNNFDLVHCHSPIGGLVTRIACRKVRKYGTKVFYTAHGFHFYKGAPKINWLIYYPVEKICSYFTDVLVTINKEDYVLALKKMKAKHIAYVPGVGIDLEKFGNKETNKTVKRGQLGIPEDAKLLLSVGELNKNKNHETVIRAISNIPNVYYIVAGKGDLDKHLQSVAEKLNISDRVKLLGFRTDVSELYTAADVFVFPSFREGLSVSVMEAMASGLPVVCSKIRGNTDLIDENGGSVFSPYSIDDCSKAIQKVLINDTKAMGEYNTQKIKNFSQAFVNEQMLKLYNK